MTVPRANWLGFLSDEERVPHGGEALVDRVRALLADPRPGPEDLFSAANLVALTLFRLGRLDEARAVCHSEIDYAGDRPDSALRPRLAALGLQPRINLLRIEGYAGDLDRALTGLAALEDVAAGRAVRSGGIDWSPGDLDADPALHRRLRTIARNVRVGDTCKILLRRGRHELLLSEASRFRALWPALTAAGLHQAAEAPWTVAPGRRSVPGPAGPRARTVQESRLAFVRELHTAAHEADTGRTAEAAESASRLAAGLPLLTGGRWASATTVPRWRAVLGAVFVRAGDERSGRALLLDALDAGRRAGDTALAGGAARWLDAAGVTIPAGPERPPDIESLLVVSGRLAARLGHRARQPRTGAGGVTAVGNLDRLIDTRQLARHWEDRPFVCAGLGALDGVFGLEVAERLLHSAALPAASVRLFRDGTELPARGHTRRRERGGAAREGLVDAAAVEREIAAGATLVMEELRTHHPEIADLCGEVTDETGLGTYCAAFLTPPGARGVAPHYDTASVLLRQVHGSKRWRIGSPLQRWPARDWSAAHNTPVDEIMDVVLHEGECLYLPRGFFHVGDATDEASLHLSIALRPITWGALIAAMAAEGQSEEPLRESLPYAFHRLGRQEFDRRLADRAAPLVARLTADGVPSASRGTVDRLRGAHPRTPPPRGALRAALTSRRPDRPQDRIAHEEAP